MRFSFRAKASRGYRPPAAGLLVASISGGMLLATIVTLALRLLPKLSAEVRSAIWLCVLLVVVAEPVLPLLFATDQASGAATGLLHADARWSYALVALWAMFSFFRLGQLAVSAWQLRGLARRAMPIASGTVASRILNSSRRLVQLCTSTEVDRPSVAGFFRPRILLPPTLLATLSESELEQIVLHEMEHLRRRDDWTNLLQKLCVALLPLHPVVAWLDRRLCLERELACDDGVMRATQSRRDYAACLTNLAEHSLLHRGISLALGALGADGTSKPRSEVAKRVYRILSKPEAATGSTQSRVAAGALLAGVLGGAVMLAHTPHLISFAPVAKEAALALSSPVTEAASSVAPHAQAFLATATMAGPHATYAKAIITPRATSATLRVAAHRPASKHVQQQPRIAQVTQDKQVVAPLLRFAAWSDSEMPTPGFALAVQTDSQFTYAAVPFRGGWLIVQL